VAVFTVIGITVIVLACWATERKARPDPHSIPLLLLVASRRPYITQLRGLRGARAELSDGSGLDFRSVAQQASYDNGYPYHCEDSTERYFILLGRAASPPVPEQVSTAVAATSPSHGPRKTTTTSSKRAAGRPLSMLRGVPREV